MGFSKGKQRIELRKIEKQSSLHATFSKRRTGLFKKANELTVLCGSEVAVLVFSPAGKVFTFGHPDANAVINRFLAVDGKIEQLAESTSSSSSEKDIGVKVEELSRRLRELDSWIEEEKKRLMVLNEINGNLGTMKNLDDLGLDRLMGYEKMMMEMKNQLAVIIANGHCPIDDDLLLNDDFKLDRLIGSVDLETCAKILMSD